VKSFESHIEDRQSINAERRTDKQYSFNFHLCAVHGTGSTYGRS
jgi:hypothetical protein